MRTSTLLLSAALLVGGCGTKASYVHSDTVLGRVVIYRNGVAYFERSAEVKDDALKLSVPADKVDDFLRSLTVVDAATGEPTPVSYPTRPALEAGTGLIDMTIRLGGPAPHRLKLSYVTEAPSWKPSYRLVLGGPGKVEVQGWAVVDNNSGEDWNQVKLGVGSSSAMSFRYDLHSVRTVRRETLRSDDLFAQAPPTGGATYGQTGPGAPVVADLSDSALAAQVAAEERRRDEAEPLKEMRRGGSMAGAMAADIGGGGGGGGARYKTARGQAQSRPSVAAPREMPATVSAPAPMSAVGLMARQLQASNNQIVIEGFADRGDSDKAASSLARANRLREQLIRNGLSPERVVAVGKGEQTGRAGGVRVVQAPPAPRAQADKPAEAIAASANPQALEPIGTAHFESNSAMTVARGSSAMVSILKMAADGEVVYLYDPETARGNAAFPFKAIRLRNPTDSVLEAGPVTVFGEGRFIGEGLIEPVPARSMAFVPFALDRQVVVERKEVERDEIARIITVQRGVFSTEMQHVRRTTFTLHNRQDAAAVVYVRHSVPDGYKLSKGPTAYERLGVAYLFRVEVAGRGKADVTIEAATPLLKTTDIRTPDGMELVRVYLSSATAQGPLKAQVDGLLKLHKDMANIEQQIATTREQMQEYRARMDELHNQIFTLREVRTGASLLKSLEAKMQEMSGRLSQATLKVVEHQEKLMIARIHFQDGVADLSLEDKPREKSGS